MTARISLRYQEHAATQSTSRNIVVQLGLLAQRGEEELGREDLPVYAAAESAM